MLTGFVPTFNMHQRYGKRSSYLVFLPGWVLLMSKGRKWVGLTKGRIGQRNPRLQQTRQSAWSLLHGMVGNTDTDWRMCVYTLNTYIRNRGELHEN